MLSALAVSYAFENRAKEAATFYNRLLDAQVSTSDFAGAAATSNALGRVYLETGAMADAERVVRERLRERAQAEGLARRPAETLEGRWLHAKARIAARGGHTADAARLVAQAKHLVDSKAPGMTNQLPAWQYLAGYAALYAKDYDAAVAALDAADVRDPFVLALLAQAWQGKGDAARARETWEKVLGSRAHNLQNAFARPKAVKALGR